MRPPAFQLRPLPVVLLLGLFGLGATCGPVAEPEPADAGRIADGGGPDAGPGDGGQSAASLVVATYNVHLFFDPVCDSGRCGPGDFEQAPTQATFDARAEHLAATLRGMGAEVLLLQELETQTAFDALRVRLADVFPHGILGETGWAGSMDVAVLSAHEILGVNRHGDRVLYRPDGTSTTFSREFLEVHLLIEGRRVVVFDSHFRSKNNDDPGRRLAEAQGAAEIVEQVARQYPQALVILGGDLNDTPGSPPLQALEASGALSRVAEELGTSAWTYVFGGSRYALDHLYWHRGAAGDYRGGSAAVLRDGEVGLGGSDHAALRAAFLLP